MDIEHHTAFDSAGISYQDEYISDQKTQETLTAAIHELNARPDIDGIVVQGALPKHIDAREITSLIDTEKEVGSSSRAEGIMSLFEQAGIEISGKHVVMISTGDQNVELEDMLQRAN